MITKIPDSIPTVSAAKHFLSMLYYNGEAWHPEDDVRNAIIAGNPTPEQCDQLNKLMGECFKLMDPCEYLLKLHKVKDREDYKGHLIFTNKGHCALVYKDGVCLAARAGSDIVEAVQKAKNYIDTL